jgi:hypothetical protein
MINKLFLIGSCILFSTDALCNPQDVVKKILAFSAATTLSLSPMVSNAVDMSGSYSGTSMKNVHVMKRASQYLLLDRYLCCICACYST